MFTVVVVGVDADCVIVTLVIVLDVNGLNDKCEQFYHLPL